MEILIILIAFLFAYTAETQAQPPFRRTINVAPNLITDDDPTAFVHLDKAGRGERKMYDRRENRRVTLEAILFVATFDDEKTIEVRVNPEFDSKSAFNETEKYLKVIGQLPAALRNGVKTVSIHKGDSAFGGGNNNLLIHTDRGEKHISNGILAETFIHEATHASLDPDHASNPKWLAAQKKDPEFVCEYAKKNPNREDVAASFILYLALRFRPDRIDEKTRDLIVSTMPNRIAYFDNVEFDLHPLKTAEQENSPDGK